jgi:mono/diheme cytochrome c family protein
MRTASFLSPALALGVLLLLPVERAAAKVDFVKEVKPVLDQNCIKCHGPEKQKGKLRLDSKEAAFKKEGIIVSGSPDKSDLYRRITLPKGHDDVMPSEGDPLTKAQTDLIKTWIAEGADWPAGVATPAAQPAKPKSGVEALGEYKPKPEELQAIEKLQASGINIIPVAMNLNWRDANLSLLGTNVTDETLAQIKNIKSLVYLNLRNTRVTDKGLAQLKGLENLLSLNLAGTAVTDAGLAQVKDFSKLEYLNLYGTGVTDAGIAQLKGLKNLRAIYLWQTKVTEAGATDLEKAIPGLKPNRGIDLTALAKKEEKKEEKPAEKKEEKK